MRGFYTLSVFLCLLFPISASAVSFNNALVDAADRGNESSVTRLVKEGFPIDSKGNFGVTPLMRASFRGYAPLVSLLLREGADPNLQDIGGATALHLAVRQGYYDVVKLLLEYGANVDATDADGWTPVMRSASIKQTDISYLLIAHDADINRTNTWGESTLVLAAKAGNHRLVRHLITRHSLDKNDVINAASIALQRGHTPIVKLLQQNNGTSPDSNNTKKPSYANNKRLHTRQQTQPSPLNSPTNAPKPSRTSPPVPTADHFENYDNPESIVVGIKEPPPKKKPDNTQSSHQSESNFDLSTPTPTRTPPRNPAFRDFDSENTGDDSFLSTWTIDTSPYFGIYSEVSPDQLPNYQGSQKENRVLDTIFSSDGAATFSVNESPQKPRATINVTPEEGMPPLSYKDDHTPWKKSPSTTPLKNQNFDSFAPQEQQQGAPSTIKEEIVKDATPLNAQPMYIETDSSLPWLTSTDETSLSNNNSTHSTPAPKTSLPTSSSPPIDTPADYTGITPWQPPTSSPSIASLPYTQNEHAPIQPIEASPKTIAPAPLKIADNVDPSIAESQAPPIPQPTLRASTPMPQAIEETSKEQKQEADAIEIDGTQLVDTPPTTYVSPYTTPTNKTVTSDNTAKSRTHVRSTARARITEKSNSPEDVLPWMQPSTPIQAITPPTNTTPVITEEKPSSKQSPTIVQAPPEDVTAPIQPQASVTIPPAETANITAAEKPLTKQPPAIVATDSPEDVLPWMHPPTPIQAIIPPANTTPVITEEKPSPKQPSTIVQALPENVVTPIHPQASATIPPAEEKSLAKQPPAIVATDSPEDVLPWMISPTPTTTPPLHSSDQTAITDTPPTTITTGEQPLTEEIDDSNDTGPIGILPLVSRLPKPGAPSIDLLIKDHNHKENPENIKPTERVPFVVPKRTPPIPRPTQDWWLRIASFTSLDESTEYAETIITYEELEEDTKFMPFSTPEKDSYLFVLGPIQNRYHADRICLIVLQDDLTCTVMTKSKPKPLPDKGDEVSIKDPDN